MAQRTLEITAPVTWPSLTDLALSLYGRADHLDTLGREVRRLHVVTRKIGRELRVEPSGAISVLEARGITPEAATAIVERAVASRMQEVPGMTDTNAATTHDPYANLDAATVAAMRAYEKHAFGTSPATLLPNDVPTDIESTDDLLHTVTGERT